MQTCSASVLTIGDELLNGDVVNSNASWLGQQLHGIGVPCRTIIAVSDQQEAILQALHHLWTDHDLVVVSGGLGPTRDDVTKKALLAFFDDHTVTNSGVLEHVKNYFRERGRTLTDVNRRQADVPSRARVLFNDLGTAPGLLIEKDEKILVALPGVPFELYHITEKHLLPFLKSQRRFAGNENRVHWFRTTGIGESDLSENVLQDLETRIPEGVDLAFLPRPGGVDLRITLKNKQAESRYESLIAWIRSTAKEFIFSEDFGETLARYIVTALSARKATIALAESCTGGYLANALTDVPGSSTCFLGGIVAYDNSVKKDMLDINPRQLDKEGAVSATVALKMAEMAGLHLKTDYALSTTGIAGPAGGTPEKPVGTVWIGFWSRSGTRFACRYRLSTLRPVNKERTCAIAFDLLRRHINGITGFPHKPEVVYP